MTFKRQSGLLENRTANYSCYFSQFLSRFSEMASSNSTSNDSVVYEAPCFLHDTNLVRVFRVAPFAPIAFFAITGNPLVLAVVSRKKTMRKTINFFIANMAFSDLIFTLVYIPRVVTILFFGYKWLVHGLEGLIFCHMVPFLKEITVIVSVLTIVAISVDRFLAVTFPFRAFVSTKICVIVIFTTWLIAISVKIPTLFASDLDEFQEKTYCIVDFDLTFGAGSGQFYFKFIFIVLYAIPFLVTVLLNSAIVATMHKRRVPGYTLSEACNRQREETNRRVMRMVLVVVLAFLLCWSLYFVLMVLRKNGVHVSCDVLYLRLLLVHFNAALTPWLYAMFSENFRQGFGDILSKLGCPVLFARQRDAVQDNSATSGRQNSAVDNLQTSFQLQTLGNAQTGSTVQLLD